MANEESRNPICQWIKVQNNSYILHQTLQDHPYCCQYNPIKPMWAQFKGYLCNKKFNIFNSKWLLITIWVYNFTHCLACQTNHNYSTNDSDRFFLIVPTKDTAQYLFQMRTETHPVSEMYCYTSLQACAVVRLLSDPWDVAPNHWVTDAWRVETTTM